MQDHLLDRVLNLVHRAHRGGAWLLGIAAGVGLGGAPAQAADDARGAEQFELCAQCHGTDGGGNQDFLAPAIAGLDQWYVEAQLQNFQNGLRGLHPEDVGGLRMYPMSRALRNEDDLKAVAAYVAGLPPAAPFPVLEGGDAARGAETYTKICVTCHGPDGGGNQQLNAPRLRGASDWYLLSSLKKYKSGVRGSNPANVNAALMRGMSQTLTDEQAMKDVIAHIMSLSSNGTK